MRFLGNITPCIMRVKTYRIISIAVIYPLIAELQWVKIVSNEKDRLCGCDLTEKVVLIKALDFETFLNLYYYVVYFFGDQKWTNISLHRKSKKLFHLHLQRRAEFFTHFIIFRNGRRLHVIHLNGKIIKRTKTKKC